MEKNPLLEPFSGPLQACPFDKIQAEHFIPALEDSFTQARQQIAKIKTSQEPPDFANTIEALETSGEKVDQVALIFYNLLTAHTNDDMQKLAETIGPKLSQFSSDILLDQDLFKRVQTVYEDKTKWPEDIEGQTLLKNTYDDFVRNGALLNKEDKESLREIDAELSQLSPKFSDNILKSTNSFELLLERKEDLEGLPQSIIESAEQMAKQRGYEQGWLFNLQFPSYLPFMKYSTQRNLREKMWRAMTSRAFKNKYDNQEIVKRIVELRRKRAQLLGNHNHAEFTLHKRMAQSPDKVYAFLKNLYKTMKPAAEKELQELQAFTDKKQGPNPLMPWDFLYYSEKLKEEKFQFNEEELRPYFPLQRVIEGVFEHARKLYGLTFKETSDYPVYHEDVQTFEVYNEKDNRFIGLFYADFFPRESKSNGAWATNYKDQGLQQGKVQRPHASIVCNFSKPSAGKPSLLTFDEVQTLFHEFGHALHNLLSECRYRSLSGTNVYWDFVELPSQVFENWTYEKESLQLFARHHQTDEPLPEDLIEKLQKSSQYLTGYSGLRQLQFSYLDMAWHTLEQDVVEDVDDFERSATEGLSVLPKIDGSNISCAFGHVFAGGYAAGYYSYKWAEVLDADAFELFKEKGIFNTEVAESFKANILQKGGSEHPMTLYKKFRGREPDPQALLRRDGLV